MPKVFVINIKRNNWNPCVQHLIFGIKEGSPTPALETGDILLARLLKNGSDTYGVKGVWYVDKYEKVTPQTLVPWKDARYATILHFKPLILEFKGIFNEEFRGWESRKVKGLAQIRLNASIVSLKPSEIRDYLVKIVAELRDELDISVEYGKENIKLDSFLLELADKHLGSYRPDYRRQERPILNLDDPPIDIPRDRKRLGGDIVGERIDSPILNYSPLNEFGVVILFGYYMHELGFSHLEQIRTAFPDAVGMLRLDDGKLQRVRIEFEYRSRNFLMHKHDSNECDIIVCWINNWRDHPSNLTIIELKSFIENLE